MEKPGLRADAIGRRVAQIQEQKTFIMIIQLQQNITENDQLALQGQIQDLGYKVNEVKTQYNHYLIGIGKKEFDLRRIGGLDGVKDVHRVTDAYKLVSRMWKAGETRVRIDDELEIGAGDFAIMVGPCSIEGEDQIRSTVQHLVKNGIKIMRGGVYKPRSSP